MSEESAENKPNVPFIFKKFNRKNVARKRAESEEEQGMPQIFWNGLEWILISDLCIHVSESTDNDSEEETQIVRKDKKKRLGNPLVQRVSKNWTYM